MPLHETADITIQAAYDHFNNVLFDELLPRCEVVFQRIPTEAVGFVAPPVRGSSENRISLNFGFFWAVPANQAMQWLVHEMLHLWQFHYGHPAPDKSHNAEFAAKSISIGLMPSSTGGAGGQRLGEQVIDYVIRGGRFERAVPRVSAMWDGAFPKPPVRNRSRT